MNKEIIKTDLEDLKETDDEFLSLEKKIEIEFPSLFNILKRLSYEIAVVGLSEKEACLLVDFDYEQFLKLKQRNKLISRLFEMKSLQYKRNLLKTVSRAATTVGGGDHKLSLWLLEMKYPEYQKKNRATSEENEDLLAQALEFIQETTNADGVVKKTARTMTVKKPIIKDIHKLLRDETQ